MTEQLVHVALGADSYDIHIGAHLNHGELIAQCMQGKTHKVAHRSVHAGQDP